jgi:Domain of Unknown Function (DUF1206)
MAARSCAPRPPLVLGSRSTPALDATASSLIERLARAGFVAKAALYATMGVLAASAALGLGGTRSGATDTRGAMTTVLEAPLGRVLLAAIGVALLGYAAWRVVEGIADPEQRGSDAKGWVLRGSFLARGVAHGALAVSALRFATGEPSGGGDDGAGPREATQAAFDLPGGEWLVWIAALGIAGYGLYQLYRAAAAKLSKRLDTGQMSAEAGRWVIVLSRFGIGARGVVFVAIGWLLIRAATRHDAGEAGGVADALRALRDLGRWPFAAIAVGLIAYGAYEGLNARYRRVRVAGSG